MTSANGTPKNQPSKTLSPYDQGRRAAHRDIAIERLATGVVSLLTMVAVRLFLRKRRVSGTDNG